MPTPRKPNLPKPEVGDKSEREEYAKKTKPTTCLITAAEFTQHAKSILGNINGQPIRLDPREFSSGSFGWHTAEKSEVEINGKPIKVQLNILITAVGSKDAPRK